MSEYRLTLSIGGYEVTASGPDADWVKDRFNEAYQMSHQEAKKIPTGFSVIGGHLEREFPYE